MHIETYNTSLLVKIRLCFTIMLSASNILIAHKWSLQIFFLLFIRLSPGDTDPYLRVGADAGVVPADPGQTEGAGHHRAGIQQHCRHAGRDLSCLQDRVLRRTWECNDGG